MERVKEQREKEEMFSHPSDRENTRVRPIPASPVLVPVEAAEDVEPALLPAMKVQAQDSRENKEHHGEVEHHNHCSLQVLGDTHQSRVQPSLPIPWKVTMALPGGRRRAGQGWAPGLP